MRKRLITVAVLLLLVITVFSLTFLWWLRGALFRSYDGKPVTIEVSRGMTISAVLRHLETARLLPSAPAGRLYFELKGQGRSFRWGTYVFASGARPVDVIETILDGLVEAYSVTVVEGMTGDEIHDVLLSSPTTNLEQWSRIMGRVQWVADVAPDASNIEGFLFPDTYTFAVGTTAEAVARHMVDRFDEVFAAECQTRTNLDSFDSVILASLVEAETSVAEERPRVAGVFCNRLTRGMLLQCDPTVVYSLKRRGEWTGRLLRVHWLVDDPYNTYRFPGLPPGPINNPGRAALAAACHPEAHRFLYFVAKPDGGHTFSESLTEHNRAVRRLQRSRR